MAIKINQISGMPQVQDAFSSWSTDFNLVKITQSNVGGFISDTETLLKFKGSVQPLSAEQVQMKPDGQRSWEWLQIHALTGSSTNLVINDRIIYDDIPYKVMARKNWKLNGYVEYHLVEDYRNE